MRAVSIAFVLASSIVACGARTGLRSTGDAAPATPMAHGIVLKTCAPNDGPAIDFSLDVSTTTFPKCSSPAITDGVIITMWNPLPSAPGTYTIGDGSFPSGSSGYVCHALDDCAPATSGTLVVTAVSETSISGSYTLASDIGTESASFEVPVCPVAETCG